MLPPTLISLHIVLSLLTLHLLTTAQNRQPWEDADYTDEPRAITETQAYSAPTVALNDPEGFRAQTTGIDYKQPGRAYAEESMYGFDTDEFPAQATGIDYKQRGRAYAEEVMYGFDTDDDTPDFGTMGIQQTPSAMGTAAATAAVTQKEYHCPDDHGVRYRTGGKCYHLLCQTGASGRNAQIMHQIPSATSLRACADACAKEPRCAACNLVLAGQRAGVPPNTCVLFANYGDLVGQGNIHYCAPLSMNECLEPEQSSSCSMPKSPTGPYTEPHYYPEKEYGDDPNCRDLRRGPTIEYKYCYITPSPSYSSSSASCTATSYGIDPASIARGSSLCARSNNGARPTPIFDEFGEPRCCGPIREYNYGQVVGECPGEG